MSEPAASFAAEPLDPSLTSGPDVALGKAVSYCANFCRVTGAPEELLLDFALDCEPVGDQGRHLTAHRRVAISPTTAKRLIAALGSLLTQYESRFGTIETNAERRLVDSHSV